MTKTISLAMAAAASLALIGCSSSTSSNESKSAPPPKEEAPVVKKTQAPDVFKVDFDTSKGHFVVEVHRDWAPIGADHFYELVQN